MERGRNEILPFGGTNKGYDLGKDLGMAIVEEEEEVSSNSWTFFRWSGAGGGGVDGDATKERALVD